MEILYKDKHVIAINKPVGMGSQSDPSGSADAMSELSAYLRSIGEQSHLWPVHRLDKVVGGVLVYARDREYAAILSGAFSSDSVSKVYYAVVDGAVTGGVMVDYIYKDSRLSKAFVSNRERKGVKRAELSAAPLARAVCERGEKTLLEVTLKTGRFHQIRAQLASRKSPIMGDGKYGSRDSGAKHPALFAVGVCLPLRGGDLKIRKYPDQSEYPWSLFDKKFFEETK